MQTLRKENELRFQKEFGDNQLKNTVICENIAEESAKMSYSEAIYWGKKAVRFAEKAYGKRSISVTAHYDKLVTLLYRAGHHLQALEWSEKSKKMKITEYGEDSFEVAENDWMLSRIHYRLGEYDLAVEAAEKAVLMYERKYGEQSQTVFDIYLEMVSMYLLGGNEERAKEYSEIALNLAKENFGEDSIQTAKAYNRKATAFYGYGMNEEKLLLLKKALLILYNEYGVNHSETLCVYCNIWKCWAEIGYDNDTAVAYGLKWIRDNVSADYVTDKLLTVGWKKREELQKFLDET